MKKFSFSLETVLKVKEGLESKAKEDLEKVVLEIRKLEQMVLELDVEKKSLESDWKSEKQQEKGVHDYKVYVSYLKSLSERISQKQDDVMKLRNVEAKKRQAYIKARKEKKTLENLKEKKFLEWQDQFNKQEGKEIDDQSMAKFARKKGLTDE
ncbi:MAG: flagellar export protein FliJ [Chlamydiales bacterium]|nr:flagellar export protein FliJ [Chlamydiales bacterium]NCF70412.1 flagellar export protein FliJ [Chlamydiales bacterium]